MRWCLPGAPRQEAGPAMTQTEARRPVGPGGAIRAGEGGAWTAGPGPVRAEGGPTTGEPMTAARGISTPPGPSLSTPDPGWHRAQNAGWSRRPRAVMGAPIVGAAGEGTGWPWRPRWWGQLCVPLLRAWPRAPDLSSWSLCFLTCEMGAVRRPTDGRGSGRAASSPGAFLPSCPQSLRGNLPP